MATKHPNGREDRKARFVERYLEHLNAPLAYREAGYVVSTPSTAWTGACRLLRSAKVQALMAARRDGIERRTEITQDRVRLELGRVAFFDPRRLFDTESGKLIDVVKLPGEVAAAISAIEVTSSKDGERVTKVRLCGKVEALDKLCRHLGMYEDKVRIVGLEREISTLPDEELERRIIELGRGEFRTVGHTDAGSAGAVAPALPAAAREEPSR